MKKRLIAAIAIAIGIVCICSCTKVRENTFVGKWEVLYKTIGYHEYETVYFDRWNIIFMDNNRYVSGNDTEIEKEGYWIYNSRLHELTMGNKNFYVEKHGNKELSLLSTEGEMSRYFLRKINR